jgi:hypothetical protein
MQGLKCHCVSRCGAPWICYSYECCLHSLALCAQCTCRWSDPARQLAPVGMVINSSERLEAATLMISGLLQSHPSCAVRYDTGLLVLVGSWTSNLLRRRLTSWIRSLPCRGGDERVRDASAAGKPIGTKPCDLMFGAAWFQVPKPLPINLTVQARPCTTGEEQGSDGRCRSCSSGTYGRNGQCLACKQGAQCPGGALLLPEEGWWHSAPMSDVFIPCLQSEACRYAQQQRPE